MTMIEKVARAIYHATPRNRPWEALAPNFKRYWAKRAIAAVHAMREPTVEMEVAGTEAWVVEAAMEDRAGMNYRAMIDAALTEDDGTSFRGGGRDEFGDPVNILKPGDSR